MEEVATMRPKHREAISKLFGGEPLLVQAADFGWVQRARWYWVYGLDLSKRKVEQLTNWFLKATQ